ncbi:MAG: hypothetical protein UT39_C0025G0001 [Candidatus Woesebacteria bacterium GW2011_GWA1_39_21]|uniref:Uncharacterized protein n=1 Tax=Candidatus Woesebacteria bacterium GW2011_GWA1_39_21 TaxID=1618550 RepID=A0A0G0N3C1_9BACT|nr:MAG: hypothetical protein UT39_C0025G0001 [Candidatus Woesebacteria bacterium GW2011_GWA1_39_21]
MTGEKKEYELLGYSSEREYRQALSKKYYNPLRGHSKKYYEELSHRYHEELPDLLHQNRIRRQNELTSLEERDALLAIEEARKKLSQRGIEVKINKKRKSDEPAPSAEPQLDIGRLADLMQRSGSYGRQLIQTVAELGITPHNITDPDKVEQITNLLHDKTSPKEQGPVITHTGRTVLGLKLGRHTETHDYSPNQEVQEPEEDEIYTETRTFLDRVFGRKGRRS